MGKKSQNKDQNSSLSFGWFVWPSESCHAGKVIAVQLVYACMLPVETGLVSRKNCYQYKKCTNKTTMNSNNPPIIASIEYLLPILTEHSSLIKLCATYLSSVLWLMPACLPSPVHQCVTTESRRTFVEKNVRRKLVQLGIIIVIVN